MTQARLYLDENVAEGVAVGLRRRGIDVVTTVGASRLGTTDETQLRFAASEGRAIFTFDRGDFAELHQQFLTCGEHHSGIVISAQVGIGAVVKALCRLLSNLTAEELHDQLVWLRVV